MITHKEAKRLFKHLFYSAKRGLTSGGVEGNSALKNRENGKVDICTLEEMLELNTYIEQQEIKDKLLRLYKDGWECGHITDEEMEEIKKLEGQLNE